MKGGGGVAEGAYKEGDSRNRSLSSAVTVVGPHCTLARWSANASCCLSQGTGRPSFFSLDFRSLNQGFRVYGLGVFGSRVYRG